MDRITPIAAIAWSNRCGPSTAQPSAARKQDAGHDRFLPVLIDGSTIRSRLGPRHLALGRRDLSCRLISPADSLRVVEHAKRDRRGGSDSQNAATGLVTGNREGFYRQKVYWRRLGRDHRGQPVGRGSLRKTFGHRRGLDPPRSSVRRPVQFSSRVRSAANLGHVATQQHLRHVLLPMLFRCEGTAQLRRQPGRKNLAALRFRRLGGPP